MSLLGVAVWFGALAGCGDQIGPRLDSATPASAPRGATVLLAGSRLCGPTADCATAGGEIDLGIGLPATRANVVDYADTRIALVVPSLAALGTTQIILTVDEQASNALGFEVLP